MARRQLSPKPTRRQRELLSHIKRYIAEHGYPPSTREMQAMMKVGSTNAVACHLEALVQKGYVEVDPMVSRGIRVTQKGGAVAGVARFRDWHNHGTQRLTWLVRCHICNAEYNPRMSRDGSAITPPGWKNIPGRGWLCDGWAQDDDPAANLWTPEEDRMARLHRLARLEVAP